MRKTKIPAKGVRTKFFNKKWEIYQVKIDFKGFKSRVRSREIAKTMRKFNFTGDIKTYRDSKAKGKIR